MLQTAICRGEAASHTHSGGTSEVVSLDVVFGCDGKERSVPGGQVVFYGRCHMLWLQ